MPSPDPEKRRAQTVAWRARNRDRVNRTWRSWRDANLDQRRQKDNASARNRRKALRQWLLDTYGSACYLCGCELTLKTLTVDHLQPKSKGGKNRRENLRPACFECNREKSGDESFPYGSNAYPLEGSVP